MHPLPSAAAGLFPDFPTRHLPGAHHPHCPRHRHHLLWIAGRPLCLGCTCMYTGMVIGLPMAVFIARLDLSFLTWSLLHFGVLTLPTALQPWVQIKSFKVISRLILGIQITSYWISGVLLFQPPVHPWLFRVFLVAAFLLFYKLLSGLRKAHLDDPCRSCPQGIFPTCEWNRRRAGPSSAPT